jgi:hypothetical protein
MVLFLVVGSARYIRAFEKNPNSVANPVRSDPRFEQFKEFIANPPAIEDLRFSYVGPPELMVDRFTQKSTQVPGRKVFIRGQWSADFFASVIGTNLEDLSTAPFSPEFDGDKFLIFVQARGRMWTIDGRHKTVTDWSGYPSFPVDNGNPVLSVYHIRSLPLFSLLSGGLHSVEPGSIVWRENRFTVHTKMLPEPHRIDGELFRDSNGLPFEMNVQLQSTSGYGRFVARYSYGTNTNIPVWFPERIVWTSFHEGVPRQDKDISLFKWKFADPLSSQFQTQFLSWVTSQPFDRRCYTNKNLYTVVGTDTNAYFHLIPHPIRVPEPLILAHSNRYFYLTSVILFFGFLVLTIRTGKVNGK